MSAQTAHRSYWIYILFKQRNGTRYVGVTNSLQTRIWQHRQKQIDGFSKRYGLDRLTHLEEFRDVTKAIDCEKGIKG